MACLAAIGVGGLERIVRVWTLAKRKFCAAGERGAQFPLSHDPLLIYRITI